MANTIERTKMVMAMEYLVRSLNDEELLDQWLMCGVADADIEYGDLLVTPEKEEYLACYTDDEALADLMGLFLRRMYLAYKNRSGLQCDGVVSD